MISALSHVQDEVERRHFAAGSVLHIREQGLIEDRVSLVAWLSRKVKLSSQHRLIGRLHFDVNVARPSSIESWKDGFESVTPCCIREQVTAQLVARVVVFPFVVSLPEVQQRVRNRFAIRRKDVARDDELGPCDTRLKQ